MSPLARYIVETSITLLGVIAVAALILYGARRAGFSGRAGPLELLGRLPLDGRRAVYLVRVADRVFVLGSGDTGLSKLAELSSNEVPVEASVTHSSFAQVLARFGARRPAPEKDEPPREPPA